MAMFLVAALAMLALVSKPCAGENVPTPTETDNHGQNQQPTPKSVVAPVSLPDEDTPAETALLESINRSREQAGIPPLRLETSLREAARLHAGRMVANQRIEHQFSGEPSLLQRIADVSPLPLDRAGENIAETACLADVHELLMRSPPHRENILDPHFNAVGITAVWSHGHLYVVQDFVHRAPTYSPRQISNLVGQAIGEARLRAGFDELAQFRLPRLDEAACSLAKEGHSKSRLIPTAASYANRKAITYTQSRPEILPPAALRLLDDPSLRQFSVGSCYARNTAYPTGIYWVAILFY